MDLRSSRLLWSLCLVLLVTEVMALKEAQRITFRALDGFPESFDWDAAHGRFLVGSTTSGSLLAVSVEGDVENFVTDEFYGGKNAVLGVTVDSNFNRVVVAVQNLQATEFSAVAAYDLDTRKQLFFTRLDSVGVEQGEKSCANDVAVDSEGNAYVTNCCGNFVWEVTKDGIPSVFAQRHNFNSQPIISNDSMYNFCGLNGIIYHRRRELLLVTQSNTGTLYRIDTNDKSVHVVKMKEKLPMADGMVLREDGAVIVVSREKAWLLGSTKGWMTADIVDTISLNSSDIITAVASKDRSIFILHTHMSEHTDGQSRETFEVREIKFPREAGYDDPVWLILVIVLFVVVVSAWRFQMGHFYKEYKRKRM